MVARFAVVNKWLFSSLSVSPLVSLLAFETLLLVLHEQCTLAHALHSAVLAGCCTTYYAFTMQTQPPASSIERPCTQCFRHAATAAGCAPSAGGADALIEACDEEATAIGAEAAAQRRRRACAPPRERQAD